MFFWYHLAVSYHIQLRFVVSQNDFVDISNVSRCNHHNWATKSVSIIGACTATFKVCKLPFHGYFRWSRARITFIKPNLGLNGVLSHQKAMINQKTNLLWIHCFENLTKTPVTWKLLLGLPWNFDNYRLKVGTF